MTIRSLKLIRTKTTSSASSFFVTTPIYYVNASPHIGHLYSSVIADAIHRWQHLLSKGAKFKFSTGTDEHGSKIQQAASKNGSTPFDYCGRVSRDYKRLAGEFSIDYTDFIRTSEESHKVAVHKFWEVLKGKGKIFSGKYGGWYCVSDESFLTESQLKEKVEPDGRKTIISGESGHPVEWIEEVNYMFPLATLQDDLKYWIRTNENAVRPPKFRKILQDMLEGVPLDDLSISRPSTRVQWGIQVPGDSTQTIYVWLDALVNYLTAAGYGGYGSGGVIWPPNLQVIGKDILKFHGIYWPAFLIAAGLEPPKSILCHSHWLVDGEKMSKSKNNVVCPFQASRITTADGLRYFLLREGVAHSDGNYSNTKLIRILNSELADTLGNLLSRCCGNALNFRQTVPPPGSGGEGWRKAASLDVTKKLMESVEALPDVCMAHYSNFNFYKAVDSVIASLHQANLFFESLKPWELKKENKVDELDGVLHLTLETLRVCGILLQPVIPNISSNLLNKISVRKEERFFEDAKKVSWKSGNFLERKLSEDKGVLFRRIVMEASGGKKEAASC